MNLAGNRLLSSVCAALLLAWCAGMFGRGFWTPDEPREADIAWRMSWQTDKAVPLLAGDAFCEKPPLTYWAAALPIDRLGMHPWAARLPNLLYAMITAVCVGLLSRRLTGPPAGIAAAAAVGTFLLGYQVEIWFATDAPLLAFTSLALLGLHQGFHAAGTRDRLLGYTLMHIGLALGFLSKSAFGWLVPALCLAALILWDRRWRELLRWELYAGLLAQAALILSWVWFVYAGPEGLARLKVFFWNNLAGRFTSVDAPAGLQYAKAHRNSPGKYFLELPVYLWPWTFLVIAAVHAAWRNGFKSASVRFAAASGVPALLLLSFSATARNVYLGPAIPGFALLLGWWSAQLAEPRDPWDVRAMKGTAVLLIIAAVLAALVMAILMMDAQAPSRPAAHTTAIAIIVAAAGIMLALYLAADSWSRADRGSGRGALAAMFFSFSSLLIAPAWFAYGQIDRWQNLAQIGSEVKADTLGRPLILLAPDETTRALVDLYVGAEVLLVPEADVRGRMRTLARFTAQNPASRVLVQIDGRDYSPLIAKIAGAFKHKENTGAIAWELAWLAEAHLRIAKRYSLPNGRRYALLEPAA
jgi:4-amino-4-deoxy-L-arabinose transferase-like glycosyltransferase